MNSIFKYLELRKAFHGALGKESLNSKELLYILGHVFTYLGFFFIAIDIHCLRNIVHIGIFFQVFASIHFIKRIKGYVGVLLVTLFLYLLILSIYGFVRGNWFSYLAFDIFTFSLLICILIGKNGKIIEKVARVYALFLIPSIVVTIIFLITYEPVDIGQRFSVDAHVVFNILHLLYPSLFVAMFYNTLERIIKVITLLSVSLMFLIGIITMTKLETLLPLLVLLIITLNANSKIKILKSLSILIIFFLIMFASIYSMSTLRQAFDNFIMRINVEDITSARNLEATLFLEDMIENDILFGRGLGGSSTSTFWADLPQGIHMVHYGFLHIILKGGATLLALMVIILLVAVKRSIGARNCLIHGSRNFVILFITMNIVHTQFLAGPVMSLFALASGHMLIGGTAVPLFEDHKRNNPLES
jgi:hypothetical protein